MSISKSKVDFQRRYLHPADILNNLDIVESGFLKLKQLRCLLQHC